MASIGIRGGVGALLWAAAFLLVGCGAASLPTIDENERLIMQLTLFDERVALGDYEGALEYVTPEDAARIRGPGDKVSEEMALRMQALPVHTLIKTGRVRLEDGKLAGVHRALPVVRTGESVAIPETETKVNPVSEGEKTARPDEEELERQRAIVEFVEALDEERYTEALARIHPAERSLVAAEGRLTPQGRDRLLRLDRTSLGAMTLTEGKLTGLALVLPPPVPELRLVTEKFYGLLERERFEDAVAMLIGSERRHFTDDGGRLKPGARRKLERLREMGDWRSFYLHDGKLVGAVAQVAGRPSA